MATFTGSPNFTATGTGAATRPAADVMDEVVFAANFSGYDETGATDSSAAIMAANAVAVARKRELVLTGTPRIAETLVIDLPTAWRMQGPHIKPGFEVGNSGGYILVDADFDGDAAIEIQTTAHGTVMEGVCLYGETGNGADGFLVKAAEVELTNCSASFMGRDGCHIGSSTPGDNANAFRLINFRGGYSGRDGLHIDDDAGGGDPIDANAGHIDGAVLDQNGRHGLYVNRARLGTTFVGCLFEGNTGYGIYLDSDTAQNVFVGGDVEGNSAGNVFEAVALRNSFFSVTVLGARYDTFAQVGLFTPVIQGGTSAGSATYSIQNGFYGMAGRVCHFFAEVAWTGHTGTGDLRLGGLPFTSNSYYATMPSFVPTPVYSSGISLPAGAQLLGGYNHNVHQVLMWTSNAGALAQLPMQASGTLYVSGVFHPYFPE